MHRTTYPLDPTTPIPDHELLHPTPEPEPNVMGLALVLMLPCAAFWFWILS